MTRWASAMMVSLAMAASGIANGVAAAAPKTAAPKAPAAKAKVSKVNPVDAMFASYVTKLPAAVTLSEMNGATGECHKGSWATYTLLRSAAAKLPINSDADLVPVIKWAFHADQCIRYIAVDAVVTQLGYDRNQLSIPTMNDPQSYQFHAIMAALKKRLDTAHTAYELKDFGALIFPTTTAEVTTLLQGEWLEEIGPNIGFQTTFVIDAKTSKLIWKHLPTDPKFPDSVYSAQMKPMAVVDGHFVLGGDPNQQFWPVTRDVIWFRSLSPYWDKLRRVH